MKNGKRDYEAEKNWEKTKKPSRLKDRAMRHKARAMVAKAKGVKATSLKGDVGHKKALSRGGKNTLSNLFVQNAAQNQSFARNKNGSMKSETSKRERGKK
jgi:hypothetical protein